MSRILVLGGYGGFGARIARRLAGAGHDVLVAGRSIDKARAFCAGRERLTPVLVDRTGDLRAALAQLVPHLLVDAAGPFQQLDYGVPRACVAEGVHYLDIADGRDFVAGIAALDADARAAGVAVISGASSVPALSGAVVRELAQGMGHVNTVEMAISASNRATAGASVAAAILDYLGQPIRLWRGQCWTTGHGWQEMLRVDFTVPGVAPLRNRLVGLADVPDLALLPGRIAGRPAVTFRAGTELGFQNIALWLVSWAVRWRLLRSASGFGAWLVRGQRLTARLGSDRSAMRVSLYGMVSDRRVERRWTLIAADGDGPEIPALAVPLLVDRILSGHAAPGARDAGECLDLADFEPLFAALSIRHEAIELPQPEPLYARVMKARFHHLPPSLRALHDVLRDGGASGRASVVRGQNILARLVAALVGFPAAGEHELHVRFSEREGRETWVRDFSGKCFRSHMSEERGLLVERFGLLRFAFDLPSDATGLTMVMRRWSLAGIPLPILVAPQSEAREWEEDGLFHFDVPITLPVVGLIVHYRGWLKPAVMANAGGEEFVVEPVR
ncbi:MAG: DUF4166 domain-containing protein [Sphingomonadaceae bacterium]